MNFHRPSRAGGRGRGKGFLLSGAGWPTACERLRPPETILVCREALGRWPSTRVYYIGDDAHARDNVKIPAQIVPNSERKRLPTGPPAGSGRPGSALAPAVARGARVTGMCIDCAGSLPAPGSARGFCWPGRGVNREKHGRPGTGMRTRAGRPPTVTRGHGEGYHRPALFKHAACCHGARTDGCSTRLRRATCSAGAQGERARARRVAVATVSESRGRHRASCV